MEIDSRMIVVGIDPGLKGGLARMRGWTQDAIPMPVTPDKKIDGHAVAMWLRADRPDLVVIEKVGAMPKQGVVSMFNFGEGYGTLKGVLDALAIRYVLVTPQKWKRAVLDGTERDKKAAIEFVSNKYPDINLIPKGCRKPSDGIADAVCIADYGVYHGRF